MKKFRIWIAAHFTNKKVWRVTYTNDNRTTRLLDYEEAWNLKEIYGGVLWIDYKLQKL
jgi:hypothetical protein